MTNNKDFEIKREWDILVIHDKKKHTVEKYNKEQIINTMIDEWKKQWIKISIDWDIVSIVNKDKDWKDVESEVSLNDFIEIAIETFLNWLNIKRL